MYLLTVSNHHIKNILNTLTLTDDSRRILEQAILRFDPTYVGFLYDLFCVYSNLYFSVASGGVWLDQQDMQRLREHSALQLLNMNFEDILTCDKYDLLYSLSAGEKPLASKFSISLYEDMYERLAELVGDDSAHWYMEDVFDAIEVLMGVIESAFFRFTYRGDEDNNTNLFVYPYFHGSDLALVVF